MKKAVASLTWHLFIDCPYCEAYIDLADEDSDYDYVFSTAIFTDKLEDLKGEEVECPDCGKTFLIEDIEY